MAKTIKKEFKANKPNVVKTSTFEEDEPILVNDKNEIIYDAEGELEKLTTIEHNYNLEFDDDIKEGLDFIKNGIDIPTELTKTPSETIAFMEKKVEELNELKEKLNNKPVTKNPTHFSTFWNGVTF